MGTIEKLGAIFMADEIKAKELFAKSPEKAAQALREEGYDVTAEDLKEFAEQVRDYVSKTESELSEEDLDEVAGGKLSVKRVCDFVMGLIYDHFYYGWW